MKRSLTLLPLVLLAGCGGSSADMEDIPPAPTTSEVTVTVTEEAPPAAAPETETETITATVTAEPEPEPTTEPTTEPEPEEPEEPASGMTEGVLAFGDTWTFSNGLQITVGETSPYELTEDDFMMEDFEAGVQFDVTVVNDTGEGYDASGLYMEMASDGLRGEEIYSEELDTDRTIIRPGSDQTYRVGFGVSDSEDLILEIDPYLMEFDWNEPALWSS